MGEAGQELDEASQEAPRYPELVRRLDTLQRYSNRILTRWMLGDMREEMLKEARSIAQTGGVEMDLYQSENRQKGRFRLNLTEDEAGRLFDAMEDYLKSPWHYKTAADTMGVDIEKLMSGNGPPDKYELVSTSFASEE